LLLAVILLFVVNLFGRGQGDGRRNVERNPFPFRDVNSGFVAGVNVTIKDFRHFGKTVAYLKLSKYVFGLNENAKPGWKIG
jgi:hypothetical protein